jgi:hypothetical protein
MSNLISRYSKRYERMVRADYVTPFPKHVFMRAQNFASSKRDRIGDRESPFDSTVIHLTERFTGKEVFLIGTMNKSTMLAERTKRLIEEVNPDAVLVQETPEWWERARMLRFVESQEEFDRYGKEFSDMNTFRDLDMGWVRKLVFWPRIWMTNYLYKKHFRLGSYDPTKAGLEVKFACEAAEDGGAQLVFLENELNRETRARVAFETRFSPLYYIWQRWLNSENRWFTEHETFKHKIDLNGWRVFTEAHQD